MLELFLPRCCAYCGRTLLPQEQGVCLRCIPILPRVKAELPDNEVERRLFGHFPLEHATSFCYYGQSEPFGNIIRSSKFSGKPWLNSQLTRLFVQELRLAADTANVKGWPYDIDLIVPIPLHVLRLLSRGYNQSVAIAEVLAEEWGIPMETRSLYKKRYTTSQVGLSGVERRRHEEGSFGVRHPERLASHHILLVDDVLTTGATVTAAADAILAAVPDVRLSVLTLSLARS